MKLETVAIRRLRDALLLSGQRPAAVLSPAFATLAREGLLSAEEQEAVERVTPIVETMVLVMAADGVLAERERQALRGAIRGLSGEAVHDSTLDYLMERMTATLAREGREARLRALGATLAPHPGEAEGAFALAAAVAFADDAVSPEERVLVEQLAGWLGLTPERASAILHELEEDRKGTDPS